MPGRVRIELGPPSRAVELPPGVPLLAAAQEAEVPIEATCGGRGTCGKCLVRVSGEVSAPTRDEISIIEPGALADGVRLACRVRALGDVTAEVLTSGTGGASAAASILERTGVLAPYLPDRAADASPGESFGLAIDLGTTTLVACVVDLASGDVVASAAAVNPQSRHGADVLSRVSAAAERGPKFRAELASAIDDVIGAALQHASVPPGDVSDVVAVGNTLMIGFLLDADTAAIAEARPGRPLPLPPVSLAADAELSSVGAASIYIPPPISAFVGPDITAGTIAAGVSGREGVTLLVDLGTNGEMVLSSSGRLTAASAAAGPAFEGAGVECGMRAESGAIEHAEATGASIAYETVGGRPPRGLCGSGLIDLVALLVESGLIDRDGAMRAVGPHQDRLSERGDQRVFTIDAVAGIVLTQRDVRELQLAKGAVRAGIDLLLSRTSTSAADVDEVLLAGGFGSSVRPDSLERIGLLPPGWAGRSHFVGNVALEGARALLVSDAARAEAERLAEQVVTVPLATDPDFRERFVSALEFP